MRINECAALIHRSDSIRVAVCYHAKSSHPRADGGGERAEVFRNGFRMNTAEAGVHLAAYL